MAIKQLSVFVENKVGSLVSVTDAIASTGVDIRALSMADTQEFGIIRMIVDDIDAAKAKLEEKGLFMSVTEVVGIAVQDRPGGLDEAVKVLSDNNINIDYMYAFISESKHYAYVVLRVDDNESAERLLSERGVKLITESDISKM
ncbi:MAG: ACT domain-containing protein [Ruminococcus sp.]|nr:ACT domain-containing protein [Ruminococcus sp.]